MNQGSVSASRPEGRKVGSSIGAFVSWDSVVVFMGIIFVLNCVEGGCGVCVSTGIISALISVDHHAELPGWQRSSSLEQTGCVGEGSGSQSQVLGAARILQGREGAGSLAGCPAGLLEVGGGTLPPWLAVLLRWLCLHPPVLATQVCACVQCLSSA